MSQTTFFLLKSCYQGRVPIHSALDLGEYKRSAPGRGFLFDPFSLSQVHVKIVCGRKDSGPPLSAAILVFVGETHSARSFPLGPGSPPFGCLRGATSRSPGVFLIFTECWFSLLLLTSGRPWSPRFLSESSDRCFAPPL